METYKYLEFLGITIYKPIGDVNVLAVPWRIHVSGKIKRSKIR